MFSKHRLYFPIGVLIVLFATLAGAFYYLPYYIGLQFSLFLHTPSPWKSEISGMGIDKKGFYLSGINVVFKEEGQGCIDLSIPKLYYSSGHLHIPMATAHLMEGKKWVSYHLKWLQTLFEGDPSTLNISLDHLDLYLQRWESDQVRGPFPLALHISTHPAYQVNFTLDQMKLCLDYKEHMALSVETQEQDLAFFASLVPHFSLNLFPVEGKMKGQFTIDFKNQQHLKGAVAVHDFIFAGEKVSFKMGQIECQGEGIPSLIEHDWASFCKTARMDIQFKGLDLQTEIPSSKDPVIAILGDGRFSYLAGESGWARFYGKIERGHIAYPLMMEGKPRFTEELALDLSTQMTLLDDFSQPAELRMKIISPKASQFCLEAALFHLDAHQIELLRTLVDTQGRTEFSFDQGELSATLRAVMDCGRWKKITLSDIEGDHLQISLPQGAKIEVDRICADLELEEKEGWSITEWDCDIAGGVIEAFSEKIYEIGGRFGFKERGYLPLSLNARWEKWSMHAESDDPASELYFHMYADEGIWGKVGADLWAGSNKWLCHLRSFYAEADLEGFFHLTDNAFSFTVDQMALGPLLFKGENIQEISWREELSFLTRGAMMIKSRDPLCLLEHAALRWDSRDQEICASIGQINLVCHGEPLHMDMVSFRGVWQEAFKADLGIHLGKADAAFMISCVKDGDQGYAISMDPAFSRWGSSSFDTFFMHYDSLRGVCANIDWSNQKTAERFVFQMDPSKWSLWFNRGLCWDFALFGQAGGSLTCHIRDEKYGKLLAEGSYSSDKCLFDHLSIEGDWGHASGSMTAHFIDQSVAVEIKEAVLNNPIEKIDFVQIKGRARWKNGESLKGELWLDAENKKYLIKTEEALFFAWEKPFVHLYQGECVLRSRDGKYHAFLAPKKIVVNPTESTFLIREMECDIKEPYHSRWICDRLFFTPDELCGQMTLVQPIKIGYGEINTLDLHIENHHADLVTSIQGFGRSLSAKIEGNLTEEGWKASGQIYSDQGDRLDGIIEKEKAGIVVHRLVGSLFGLSADLRACYQDPTLCAGSLKIDETFPWQKWQEDFPAFTAQVYGEYRWNEKMEALCGVGSFVMKKCLWKEHALHNMSGQFVWDGDRLNLQKMKIVDKSLCGVIESCELIFREGGVKLHMPLFTMEEVRPSLCFPVREPSKQWKSLVVERIVIEDFDCSFPQLETLSGKGTVLFHQTIPKHGWLVELPFDFIKQLGLDLRKLIPATGEISFHFDKGRLCLTELKNCFTDDKRAQFYLVGDESYVDLDGNLHLNLKLRQNVVLKLAQPFVIAVRGTVQKPTYSLS